MQGPRGYNGSEGPIGPRVMTFGIICMIHVCQEGVISRRLHVKGFKMYYIEEHDKKWEVASGERKIFMK